jgi:hypothetical protein
MTTRRQLAADTEGTALQPDVPLLRPESGCGGWDLLPAGAAEAMNTTGTRAEHGTRGVEDGH